MSAEDCSKMSVMLTSSNMKRSVSFYRDKLGFELKESWPSPEDPQWCNLILGGQSIMLGGCPDPEKMEGCEGDAQQMAYWKQAAADFKANKPGVGIQVYVAVEDVDAYAKQVAKRGAKLEVEPKTQFYGIRDFAVNDPDSYRLVFFTTVTLTSCQSCGMPLTDAQPGQMYCAYCTDEKGQLHPYERVFEGTVSGYFMAMQKLPRQEAEKAAREHLAKMPAWAAR